MSRFNVAVTPDFSKLVQVQRRFLLAAQKAILIESDRAAATVKEKIRDKMAAARLGRLGNALGHTSDLKKSGNVFPRGQGFSASGVVFVRSGSPRTRGAIEAYTAGAEITPRRGRWLWIPQPDIQRLARVPLPSTGGSGSVRRRVTPGTWRASGLESKVGPLQFIRSSNGTPLLIVRNATVSASGKQGSARARTKTGKVRRGQVAQDFIVAFVGIPRTSRQARVDARAIAAAEAQNVARRLGAGFSVNVRS